MKKNTTLIIDFDSTFVQGETLEELADIVLANNPQRQVILDHMKSITRQGMEGAIPFEESLAQRIELFKANKKHIERYVSVLKKRITPSILRNKSFIRKYRDQIYIVSGGFFDYIWPVVKSFGLSQGHVLANKFSYDSQGAIIGYDQSIPLCKKGGKAEMVKRLKLTGNVYIIGDGHTDYEIKREGFAKAFISFTENIERDVVSAKADAVCRDFDETLQFILNQI